ncbi:UDP-N-acetylmuramate--L-alanine ligase [Paludibacter sp. 221]|uniref:UDP-N-acetylmuramate--L-alanine ligase n=1 Tax=Paludibacter sp. 221 TaxID=2302939 RepID=UPI0013D12A91|nr:UDP-N-acetylmuramate--L-alanine ligase [Paludibacter sp. 221]NDV47567.1 UDP-N-acetylmuramate--L-alanine ligase [Paludibacter sp. 221]
MSNFFRYYFLGIGGIGMSALARYFNAKGFQVAGYDRTESLLTKSLQAEGITITYDDCVDCIPENFKYKNSTMVIMTPAIPDDHPQLLYFRENNFTIHKRAQVLGDITRQQKGICIAGTHGKTTTSTITAHLLYQSHVSCSAFLGGIANNYQSNLLLSKESNLVVIEADEYDRSFHQLAPYMAVITSMDADHLDIYKTAEAFYESFEHFASLITPGGVLIVRKGIELNPKLQKGVKQYTYSMDEGGDFHAEDIRQEKDRIYFDFVAPTERINDLYITVPVMINVENSIAAIALAWLNGATKEEIRTGISSFSGIYRRFNIIHKSERTVYVDDYAHHPNELKASINSIRKLYPDKKITGIFQPHLYTRTRDFATEFAESLSLLDKLILLDIYPAREKPIRGVSSKLIFDNVNIEDKTLCSKENLLSLLEQNDAEVLVTFGAGDIDQLVPQIGKLLKSKCS